MKLRKLIVKTVIYRVCSMSITAVVAFAITRDWGVSLAIGGVTTAIKTVFYFCFEMGWKYSTRGKSRVDNGE